MTELLALFPGYLTAHLQLSLLALALGGALSLPLGVWVTRRPRLESAALGAASVVQTVPSLALLAFMVPALAWASGWLDRGAGVELSSIGFLPALIGLTLYSVLPMLRNTVTGIAGVEPAVIEAARAVGMTARQRLWRVELPLALPVIIAGVRTAAVWVVGTATLSTPVGAPSLGNYIFSGLQTRNYAAVLLGCVGSAGLALALDGLIRGIERAYRARNRAGLALTLGIALLLLGVAVGSLVPRLGAPGAQPVAIGSKPFTEQYVLGELLSLQIERRAGAETRSVPSLGSTVAFDALRSGEIDVYVDYSGTIWATIMKRQELPPERAQVLREVTDFLEREAGVGVIASLGFENTYAVGMRKEHAAELGVERISELARLASRFEIASGYEFFARPEWRALRDSYGLDFAGLRGMDPSLMYPAVRDAQVDVIAAYSTDGRIAAYDIALLEDDLGVIPPYDALVLASARLRSTRPEVVDALRELEGALDENAMRRLNLRVDRGGEAPRSAARDFLDSRGR
ncbi:MAG: ABC transporter permease/substrate-binding protein [Proteobacteria bacterium]|nr:ABC transporter permease/substrate-binding protein [Pseudomonadota bacterium]